MLKDKEMELAVVATPSTRHAPDTIQAMKTGKNVVCEKPMATKLSDADRMILTAKKTGRVLSVFQNRGLRGDFSKLSWKFFNPKKLPKRRVDTTPTPNRNYNSEKIPWQEESWDIANDKTPGQLGFYINLYNTLKKKKPLFITPESARKVMWVIEKCHRLGGI